MSEAFTGVEGGFRRETATPDGPPPEPGTQPAAVRDDTGLSSAEISTSARGIAQLKLKVYAESNSPRDVQIAADKALDLYREARGKLTRMAQEDEW